VSTLFAVPLPPDKASEFENDSDVTGATIADALDWLDDNKQPLDARLTALAGLDNTGGFLVQTGAATFARRSIDVAARLAVTNGNGVSGNPSIDLATVLTAGGPTGAAGTVPVITWDAYGRLTAVTTAAITGEALTLSDVTTNDVSTSKHGFIPKLPNVAAQFFDGVGTWRALATADLGTTLTPQFAYIGLGTAANSTYAIRAYNAASSVFASFETGAAGGQAALEFSYTGQTFRVGANAAFGGWAVNDTTAPANRVLLDTSGNFRVNNVGTAIARLEGRTTSGAQLAASYDGSNHCTVTVGSTGITTITPTGSGAAVNIATGFQMGTGTGRQKYSGRYLENRTAVGNVGAGEDDLQTLTLPANSLVVTDQAVEVRFFITCAGTANNKRIRMYAGGTTIWDSGSGSTFASGTFHLTATISRTGSSAQVAIAVPHTRETLGVNNGPTRTVLALTETRSIVFKVTGEGTADNDIQSMWCDLRFLDK